MSASSKIPGKEFKKSAALLANTTSISQLFRWLQDSFIPMFKRKAFAHTYLEQGMDWEEMSEALNNTSDLVSEYESYCFDAPLEEESLDEKQPKSECETASTHYE